MGETIETVHRTGSGPRAGVAVGGISPPSGLEDLVDRSRDWIAYALQGRHTLLIEAP
jgi:hypothetical protein